jgi:hypothetical protein
MSWRDRDNELITNYLNSIDDDNKIYLDIGASNITNLPSSFIQEGNKTVFFESDNGKASNWSNSNNFTIVNKLVTPDNVVDLIREHIGEKTPTYLDIDIDGYDFFVLQAILENMRPLLIVAEMNEKIPVPIKFTVNYSPNYSWDNSHFYGMSVSKFYELAEKYEYDVVTLNFNNIYAIRKDKNATHTPFNAQEVYDQGYKTPRLSGQAEQFYYNENFDYLLSLGPEEALSEINKEFVKYKDNYTIKL